MDARALAEALFAFAVTPVISIGMVLVVVAGIFVFLRKADRQ